MEFTLQGAEIFEKGRQITTYMAKIYKERVSHGHGELYIAMGKLTASELGQAYASLKLDSNQHTHHELIQNQDDMDCYGSLKACRHGSQSFSGIRVAKGTESCTLNRPYSRGHIITPSVETDEIMMRLEGLQSDDRANVLGDTDCAHTNPPGRGWKRIMKRLC
jgi:hypothetical protein